MSNAVGFALSSSLIRLRSDPGTLSGAFMARRAGKAVSATGREPPERARPTAPDDFTKLLEMSVYGRPITKEVEDTKRPNFGYET